MILEHIRFLSKIKEMLANPTTRMMSSGNSIELIVKPSLFFNNFLFHTIPSGEPPEQRSNLYNISKVDRMLVKNGSSVKWVKPYKHYFGLRMKINGGKSELPDDETAEYITPIEIDPEVGNGGNCFVIC